LGKRKDRTDRVNDGWGSQIRKDKKGRIAGVERKRDPRDSRGKKKIGGGGEERKELQRGDRLKQ